MDKFNEYWELLSDKSVHIGKELIAYYKTLHENEDGSPLSEQGCHFLLQNLLVNPYPTCQLLRLLATSKIPLKNNTIREICDEGMLDFLESFERCDVDKFYNLIANNLLSSGAINQAVPIVLRMLDEQLIDKELLLLALVSRKSQKLLKYFLKKIETTREQGFLQAAVEDKRHFMEDVLNGCDMVFNDAAVSDYVCLFRLIVGINGEEPRALDIPQELQFPAGSFLGMYLKEIRRTELLRSLFDGQEAEWQVADYAKESSIIAMHMKKGLKILPSQYDQLLEAISENDKLNEAILKDFLPANSSDMYFAEDARSLQILMLWYYMMDVLKLSPQQKTFSEVLESRASSIKAVLKSVENTETFVSLLESMLTLLFVRYEHLPKRSHGQVGFMCSNVILEVILSNLKFVAAPKKHAANYDNVDDQLKVRLTKCIDIINDALWRISLFASLQSSDNSSLQLTDIDSSSVITKLPDLVQDDEDSMFHSAEALQDRNKKYSTFPKRKHSKHAPKPPQISSSGSTGTKIMRHSLPPTNKISSSLDSVITEIVPRPRSLIPKMLGSPEKLATFCLVQKKFDEAKAIIRGNNLAATAVGRDLHFMESFTNIQEKLVSLIARYDAMRSRRNSGTMLEDIRSRTAIGFEAAKIISTVETFSSEQKIQQNDQDLQLLDKHSSQYPFLRLFRGDKLRNVHAMDLMLGLPMNYDLSLNLYNLVSKCLDKPVEELEGKRFAYVGFLKRLIDDMQLFRADEVAGKETVTFHRLLSQEVCPLDAAQLGPILDSRRSLISSGSLENFKENGRCDRWLMCKKIRKFVDGAERLIKLYDGDRKLLSSDDIMKTDLQEIVGKLVFEKNVSLNVLEPLVAGTNSNMVHMIVHYFSKEVGRGLEESPEALSDVVEFVSEKNDLLGILLKEISGFGAGITLLTNLKNLSCVELFAPFYNCRMSAALDFDRFQAKQLLNNENCGEIQLLRLLDYVLQRGTQQDLEKLQTLRHEIVSKFLNSGDYDHLIPVETIIKTTKDINQKAEYLIQNIDRIPKGQTVLELINSILLARNVSMLNVDYGQSLKSWNFKQRVYTELGVVMENEDWRSVRDLSENSKVIIMQRLIQQNMYELCSRWIKIHPLKPAEDSGLFDTFTIGVMDASQDNKDCSALLAIIEGMSKEHVVNFYETTLLRVKNQSIIKHAIEYLDSNGENTKNYQKYRISLAIFGHLPGADSKYLWNLISRPLLIIEQYLMNSKLELLSTVMDSVRPLLKDDVCVTCYEQRECIRDLRGRPSGSIDLDSSHDNQFITNECIDCLLRIYASKALDYSVSNESGTSEASMLYTSMDLSSLDSLCGAFTMPKTVPTKDAWIRDEDASQCMCCRRSVFSMLNRRHHCRRCGRVVCHSCSKKKLEIPELYEEVPVRACDDCVKQSQTKPNAPTKTTNAFVNLQNIDEWQLTGNVRNDNIIREEYSYEYAPSTSQCLAICNLHSQNEELSNFLLYHCVKLEALLRPIRTGYPNPELDYALVTRMLLNLTLAAKVRGLEFAEADKMKEHAEIILSIVKNDCESLLLQEPMSSANLRKLRDALVLAEKWSLALELSLKCGFSTSGVMAAWGTTCLRAGCYETARDKFSYCLQKLSTDADNSTILNCIESPETKLANYKTAIPIKRPAKSPPLLLEIISILESSAQAQPPEVVARASMIKSSNTSLSSNIRKKTKDNIPLHEPALNVLNTLANLKHITKGNFTDYLPERRALRNKDISLSSSGNSNDYLQTLDCIMSTRFFEESMYYLLTYGAHQDVTNFLIKHRQILPAMKYVLMQQVSPEVLLQTIILPYLKTGRLETVIQVMSSMDETLLTWKAYIIYSCRYLETNRMLNCLYNMQLLLGDPIRASMTCVRFYSMDAKSFTDLEANTFHLKNSAAHLQTELESCNWEEISVESVGDRSETHKSLLMKMEPKELNNHINTILRQLEVTKFLANCEANGKDAVGLLPKLFIEYHKIPTLFGTVHEKLQLAVLILICGKNVEEGFGLSYRVIQDFNLNSLRVYSLTAKHFIGESHVEEVDKLLQAIVSNSATTVDTNSFCDELIKNAVETAISIHGSSSHVKTSLEGLIKRISDVGLKIHCYIITGQLKTAYLYANKHGRLGDIRKILRQSEVLNQVHVKRLCESKLAAEGSLRK